MSWLASLVTIVREGQILASLVLCPLRSRRLSTIKYLSSTSGHVAVATLNSIDGVIQLKRIFRVGQGASDYSRIPLKAVINARDRKI